MLIDERHVVWQLFNLLPCWVLLWDFHCQSAAESIAATFAHSPKPSAMGNWYCMWWHQLSTSICGFWVNYTSWWVHYKLNLLSSKNESIPLFYVQRCVQLEWYPFFFLFPIWMHTSIWCLQVRKHRGVREVPTGLFQALELKDVERWRFEVLIPKLPTFFLNKVVRRVNFFLEINVGEPEKYFVPVCPGVNQLPESVGAIPHQQILRHRHEVSWPRFVCRFVRFREKILLKRFSATTNLTHARWWHGDFKGLVLCTSLLEWQVLRRASKIPWHRYEQSHAFKCIAWSCPSSQSASASLSGGWARITDMNPQCQPRQLILLKCLSHRQEFRMMIWSAAPNWKSAQSAFFEAKNHPGRWSVYRFRNTYREWYTCSLCIFVHWLISLYLHDLNLCPIAFTFRFRISGPPTALRWTLNWLAR